MQRLNLPKTLDRQNFSLELGAVFLSPREIAEPIFHSIKYMKPEFRLDDIDLLVTNCKTLTNLLDFCQRIPSVEQRNGLHVSLVRDTVIIDRYRTPATYIRGQLSSGHTYPGWNFGHAFQTAFAKFPEGFEDNRSHTRVYNYRLGHLNCLVPIGVDACLRGPSEEVQSALPKGQYLRGRNFGSDILVVPAGAVNDSPTIEMKVGRPIPKHWAQMWLSRSQLYTRAWPVVLEGKAIIGDVFTHDATDWHPRWEDANQLPLRKLTSLIRRLRDVLRLTSSKRCLLMRVPSVHNAPLELFESTDNEMPIHDHLVSKFWSPARHVLVTGSEESDWEVGLGGASKWKSFHGNG